MNGGAVLEVHHNVTFEGNVGVWEDRDYAGEGGAVQTTLNPKPEPVIVIE